MHGDVAFDEVEPIVAAITPVPGGVGAVTSTVLALHVAQGRLPVSGTKEIMNNYLSPAELLASYSAAGVRKMERSAASLLLLGALAGAIIAIAAAATNTAVYGISDTWTVRTICGLLFPFGLGLVVVTGAELFTGNCMLPLTLLEKKGGSAVLMVRNWALVFAGNALGSLLVAWLCVSCGQLNYSAGAPGRIHHPGRGREMRPSLRQRLGPGRAVQPAGLSGGAGLPPPPGRSPGRLMGAFLPVCFFVLCGFEHSVANLYYIGAALMAAAVPQYASLAAAAGVDLAPLTLTGAAANLVPVTLGNILGGAGLALLLWYCHLKQGGTPS